MVTDRKTTGPGTAKERRRFGRFAARLPLHTCRDDPAHHPPGDRRSECRLQLRDFSLDGLRAESKVPLKVNEQVTVSLPPSGRHPPVHLTGRVIHCRPHADRYEVGIQFHDRDPALRRSPYCGLPRLFSMAADFTGTLRQVPNSRERL